MSISSNIRLSLINSMLRTIGTSSLSGEDTSHPDYITANEVLEEVLEEFNSMPLWFNNATTTLFPDEQGRIVVPSTALSCDPTDGRKGLVVRDRYLFDLNNNTYTIGSAVQCYIHHEVPLSDMPREAIKFIRASARYSFYLDEDGGATKLQTYANDAYTARIKLDAVNIARMDINWFTSGAARSFFTTRSAGYQHIGAGYSSRINNQIEGNFTS